MRVCLVYNTGRRGGSSSLYLPPPVQYAYLPRQVIVPAECRRLRRRVMDGRQASELRD